MRRRSLIHPSAHGAPRDRHHVYVRAGAVLSWAVVVALLSAACTSDDGTAPVTPMSGSVVVSAAASLTDAFGDMASAFEEANPDVDVIVNVASSSLLREQILQGAPVDVFASANMAQMDQLVDRGFVLGDPAVFATNSLAIAVPVGNPGHVSRLDDFARDELFVGLCQPDVPCGLSARQALAAAGISPVVDTNEPNVRALLTKVEAGELDAGITYVTDVISAGDAVEGITIPAGSNVTTSYPIALLARTQLGGPSEAFVTFVLSEEGQRILAGYGFGPP